MFGESMFYAIKGTTNYSMIKSNKPANFCFDSLEKFYNNVKICLSIIQNYFVMVATVPKLICYC